MVESFGSHDDEYLIFLNQRSGHMFTSGSIGMYKEKSVGYVIEPGEFSELIGLKDVPALLDYVNSRFPGGWCIIDGKVVCCAAQTVQIQA